MYLYLCKIRLFVGKRGDVHPLVQWPRRGRWKRRCRNAFCTLLTPFLPCAKSTLLTPSINCAKQIRGEERSARGRQLRAGNVSECPDAAIGACIPHIDMKVLGEICREASCRRRSTNGLHLEVVWFLRPLHAEISKVECTRTKAVPSRKMCMRMRGIHVVTAPA